MNNVNQCAIILNHLMKYGKMTKGDAESIGIRNLSARIWQLRDLGCNIVSIKDGYKLRAAQTKMTSTSSKKEQLTILQLF